MEPFIAKLRGAQAKQPPVKLLRIHQAAAENYRISQKLCSDVCGLVLTGKVVGDVILRFTLRCHASTIVADSEISQIGHCANRFSPFVNGIRVGDHDKITELM